MQNHVRATAGWHRELFTQMVERHARWKVVFLVLTSLNEFDCVLRAWNFLNIIGTLKINYHWIKLF